MKVLRLERVNERLEFERELDSLGASIPLYSRIRYAEVMGLQTTLLGVPGLGGVAARWQPTRALPGFHVLQVERFGAHIVPEFAELVSSDLMRLSRERRVLEVQVDTCLAPYDVREAIARAGFRQAPCRRSYALTSLIDLTRCEAAILEGFHATGRRHIRAVSKHPVEVRRIKETGYTQRMRQLLRETFARTGAGAPDLNARGWIQLANEEPDWVGIFGTFDDADQMLGYVIAVRHGRVAEYSTAASTRETKLKVPILYAPTWDAIRWAKAAGATVWDFGGITEGTHGSGDRRGGISDFKRYFQGEEIRVGYEFEYEPSRGRARVAGWIRKMAGRR